jgi:tRNA(Met) C34 N-acetyltransferase TmcA
MNSQQLLTMALNPAQILRWRGFHVDPWQRDFLSANDHYVLLNCCRQAGKSTVTAVLALHEALFVPNSLIVILSPGQRQSSELFRKILDNYNAVGRPVKARVQTQLKLELDNNNRILCLPGKEETVRCFSPSLLIIDEASRVPVQSRRPKLGSPSRGWDAMGGEA